LLTSFFATFFQNLIQAGPDVAEPVIESQLTDCLQAHIARAQRKFGLLTWQTFEPINEARSQSNDRELQRHE
jgi:hypothetical protein